MDDTIKSRLILILAILTVIFFTGWLTSCVNARQFKVSRHEEMAKKLEAEEKLTRCLQDKPLMQEQLSSLQKGLEDEKASHEETSKALTQEQLINSSLKEELQKITKLKEALEEDLKEALVAAKQAKPKR